MMKDNMFLMRPSISSSRVVACLRAVRFRSWLSWLFIFGLGSVLFGFPTFKVIPIAISFCFVTAAGFIINGYFDSTTDALNPKKKDLPIASGDLSKRLALITVASLLILSFFIMLRIEISLSFLFLIYIISGIMYCVPPLAFKKRPVFDILIIGFISGVLPFLIGLQVSNWLRLDFSSPWMRRGYQDAFVSVLPIFFFQMSGQLFQAIGDYESDKENKINTFVVKYGPDKSLKVAVYLFAISAILPIFYGLFNLSMNKEFLNYYLMFFLILSPVIIYLLNIFRKPSEHNIDLLSKTARKTAPFLLAVLFVCIIILRASLH
jgi:4-hydroxybenzoate polyprenyltransferase